MPYRVPYLGVSPCSLVIRWAPLAGACRDRVIGAINRDFPKHVAARLGQPVRLAVGQGGTGGRVAIMLRPECA